MRNRRQQAIVQLDELATAMLLRVMREGNECYHAGEDPRDLVSAAVTYYLANEGEAVGRFELNHGDECLERAKATRKHLERKGGTDVR